MTGIKEKEAVNREAVVLTRSWEKLGKNLYRIHGDRAEKVLDEETENQRRVCEAGIKACSIRLQQVEDDLEGVRDGLRQEIQKHKTSHEKALADFRSSLKRMFLACLMVIAGIFIIAWSLAPSLGNMPVVWLAVSIGAGLSIFVVMEILLHFTEKLLTPRQFAIFNAIIAAVMVAFFIAGFVQLSKARALQMAALQSADSDNIANLDQEVQDMETIKAKINSLTKQAMILLFGGFEWLTGVFFYLASRKRKQLAPVVKLSKKYNQLKLERESLLQKIAFLENTDHRSIRTYLVNGIQAEKTKGSLPLMLTLLVIILGVLIFMVGFSEKAFGGVFQSVKHECTFYLVGFDVTGSTEHDQLENERAIIKIINSLQPCDEFEVLNITQDTFTEPEYMIYHKMPPKAGYFNEEVRRHRLRLIREFRAKFANICKSRQGTQLIDGIYLFTSLLQERPEMKRKLILISDMFQCTKDINVKVLVTKGKKVLEQLKADGLIPDMKGIEVYVMGASTAGVTTREWVSVRRFWAMFFKEAGAKLMCYSIQRHWPPGK